MGVVEHPPGAASTVFACKKSSKIGGLNHQNLLV
jgi:hypothetical protein